MTHVALLRMKGVKGHMGDCRVALVSLGKPLAPFIRSRVTGGRSLTRWQINERINASIHTHVTKDEQIHEQTNE